MNTSFATNASEAAQLTAKLAMELVYAEPGKDIGLLPVNYILTQIEELCTATPPSATMQQALAFGRSCVEKIFETTGLFDEKSLKSLGEWANWFEAACEAASHDQEPSDPPKSWLAESALMTNGTATASTPAPATPPPASVSAADLGEEPTLTLNLADDADLLREFISESYEHLQNIEQGVLVLEDKPSDTETLNSIFRAFHTFKGGSGLLNLTPVNRLAHELESLLDMARKNQLVIDSSIIDLILEGGDTLKSFTTAIDGQLGGKNAGEPIAIPILGLIARVKTVTSGAPSATSIAAPPKTTPDPTPNEEAAFAALLKEEKPAAAPAQEKVVKAAKPGAGAHEAAGATGNVSSTAMVKVSTQKLDALVDLVGEMVIAHSQVMQDSGLQAISGTRLSRNLTQLSRITDELQKTAMSLRMVPIRSTFQKMNRLVRDLASRQSKQVELVLHGEDTELDRNIVEELNDPLVHMIRNSVDHGIEKADVRASRGKPAHGTIHLSASHQGGNIVIEIRDDGGGLNRERILAKARQNGLIGENETLGESDIFQLIFAPGFSTAEVVTDVSGRGVGMDVVRRNIEKLRGKIEIQSLPGQGSTFTIFLPLTLAIIDGLLIGVGEQRFIVPTLLVRESFRPTASMISTVQGRAEMVNVRGRLLPLLRLHEHFNVTPHSSDPTQSIVLVVGSERESRCLLVDDLLGKQEVVIKSLGEAFKNNHALAGAAILGDGRVGLILNVDYLVKLRNDQSLRRAA